MAKQSQPRKPASPRTSSSSAPGPAKRGTNARAGGGGKPPAKKKPGRSIVNQRTRPWGLIGTGVALVAAAAVVITIAVTNGSGGGGNSGGTSGKTTAWSQPEVGAARAITGVVYKPEPKHTHRDGTISYDTAPPTGGDHNGYWADCAGTVYPQPIANENAVHMLEHGAVWITYRPGLPAAQVQQLAGMVDGVDRMALSPYPNLATPISVQAWGYQLTATSPADPRIAQFIAAVRYNPKTTPEYGATCSQPSFKTNPSRYGQPRSGPGMP